MNDELYYCLRVTGVQEMHVAWDEINKRQIVGFGMREDRDTDGKEVNLHAHYILFTNRKTIKCLRDAFTRRGVKGNECYCIQEVKDYALKCKYVCKFYTPETVEYQFGWAYNHEWFAEQKQLWDAGYDASKIGKGVVKKTSFQDMLEFLMDGLNSESSRQQIAWNLRQYRIANPEKTQAWTDERCRALITTVELQLKSHARDMMNDEWVLRVSR